MKWLSDRIVQRLREEVDLPDLSSTKYRLIQKLDSGGMGAIYLAEDMDLDRSVALKVMHADPSAELAQRMLREARIVAWNILLSCRFMMWVDYPTAVSSIP